MKRATLIVCGLGLWTVGATAKDLPRHKAAEEPKHATGCEFLGEGYVRAPGSDTCIKVGGLMRVEGSSLTNR